MRHKPSFLYGGIIFHHAVKTTVALVLGLAQVYALAQALVLVLALLLLVVKDLLGSMQKA